MGIIAKIKALWMTRKALNQVKEVYVKNGLRTTEFYLTLLATLTTMLEAFKGNLDPKWAAVATSALALGYAVVRAITKAAASVTAPPAPPAQ